MNIVGDHRTWGCGIRPISAFHCSELGMVMQCQIRDPQPQPWQTPQLNGQWSVRGQAGNPSARLQMKMTSPAGSSIQFFVILLPIVEFQWKAAGGLIRPMLPMEWKITLQIS